MKKNEKDLPSDYRRWLDLSKSIAFTTFTRGNVHYVREYIVSRDKDVILIHLKADIPKSIHFTMSLSRPERGNIRKLAEGKLELYGSLDSGSSKPGVRYAAIAGVVCKGKQTKQSTDEKSIVVRNADETWIVVSAKTSYLSGEIYETEADRLLNEALRSNFSEILPEAVRSYQALYNRAGICLPENEAVSHLTTDERIEKFQKQDDPSLAALYYNYGRYLLISSTRPGSLPPNLQGLWANATGAPWNGDYHTNINVQMNHWPVEQANLSELYTPLIDLVKRLVDSGKESAKAFYGPQAKGWVLHMMTNVWNYTVPGYCSRRTSVMGSHKYRRSMALRTFMGTLSFQRRPEISGRHLSNNERSFGILLFYHGTGTQTRLACHSPDIFSRKCFLFTWERPYAHQRMHGTDNGHPTGARTLH